MPPNVTRQAPRPVARPVNTSRPTPAPAADENVWDMVDTLHALIYGASGTGKTTLASTWPGPTLWLICSGGGKPGELRSINTPENRRKITPRIVRSVAQINEEIAAAADYATTVLDHTSGFADLVLQEILGKPLPAQKGWGLASQQQYGQMALICKDTFRRMLSLPGHVLFLAQERTFGGGDEGPSSEVLRPTVGAALTPSLVGWLNPACDYVLQTYKRPRYVSRTDTVGGKEVTRQVRGQGVEYCLRTEPHEIFTTKFRLPKGHVLPECIVDPDYTKIMAVIEGTYGDGGQAAAAE